MVKNTFDSQLYWRVNEIKNAVYCPRISFYALCLGLDRETAVSRIGIEAEAKTKKRMRRRKHALHAVHDGERVFDIPVIYHPLRLIGRLDEIVVTDDGVYLVDYKDTDTDYGYWALQMAAYRLGIAATGTKVLGCYIYTIPDQQYKQVKVNKGHENRLHEVIDQLELLIYTEVLPMPTKHPNRCLSCQYSCFCNDRR